MITPITTWAQMPDADYFAAIGESQSALKHMQTSAKHYRHYVDNGIERTDAMKFGNMFDCLIFDEDRYKSNYVTLPEDYDGRTTDGKARKRDIEASGREAIKFSDAMDLACMRRSLMDHPEAGRIIKSEILTQVAFFAPWKSLQLKGKIDVLPVARPFLCDVKSTCDVTKRKFEKQVFDTGWHIQAAFYLDGWNEASGSECEDFILLAVEKEPPFCTVCYALEPKVIAFGRKTYRKLLDRVLRCQESGIWPGVSDGIESVALPYWAEKEMELE